VECKRIFILILNWSLTVTEWAAIMVHSRAFTLPVKPDDQYAPYVMMPYMDMINHHYHYQVLILPCSHPKTIFVCFCSTYLINQACFKPSCLSLFVYYRQTGFHSPYGGASSRSLQGVRYQKGKNFLHHLAPELMTTFFCTTVRCTVYLRSMAEFSHWGFERWIIYIHGSCWAPDMCYMSSFLTLLAFFT
jgi:hypothetical protein